MKIRQILILLTISFASFGQSKFVGEFNRVMQFSDTLENPKIEYLYNRRFIIKSDFTYTYSDELNMPHATNEDKESIKGSWKANGDTITFYNKNYHKPKEIEFNHKENQNFQGIKVVVKNSKGKSLDILTCYIDSISADKTHGYIYRPYKLNSKNSVIITDTSYTKIHIKPKNLCKDFSRCDLSINLFGLKSGTLIEVICNSTDIELRFNGKQYILSGNILHEISTSCNMPDAWTDNFIKKK